jgi:hypothetical protein
VRLLRGDIQQFEADAKAFFFDTYGIDVDDPIFFSPQAVDPRARYRVVSMTDRVVTDSAYILTIVDPAGFELGGEFVGIVAPVGASMAYGRYHIDTGEDEPIMIDLQSVSPYVTDPFGMVALRCDVFSEQLGSGESYVSGRYLQEPDGDFVTRINNVLTFE